MLESTGGASGTWSANGYCLQIAEHALVGQIEGFGSVNSASVSDIFVRFAEPLVSPVQGGTLDGTRFYAASGTPSDDATASLALIGTGSQTDVDSAAV